MNNHIDYEWLIKEIKSFMHDGVDWSLHREIKMIAETKYELNNDDITNASRIIRQLDSDINKRWIQSLRHRGESFEKWLNEY